MALTATLVTYEEESTSTSDQVTPSFSVPNGDPVIIVCRSHAGSQTLNSVTGASIRDAYVGGGAWWDYTTNFGMLYLVPAIGTGVSGAVTIDWQVSSSSRNCVVVTVPGAAFRDPYNQGVSTQVTSSSLIADLSTSPLLSSIVVAAGFAEIDTSSITPGTDFTDIHDVDAGSWRSFAEYRINSTSTTVRATSGSASGDTGLAAIELVPSARGAGFGIHLG